MTSYERIKGMVEGKKIDRIGVAAWYHMPLLDHNAKDFADGIIQSCNFMKWDICKVQSHSFYVSQAPRHYYPAAFRRQRLHSVDIGRVAVWADNKIWGISPQNVWGIKSAKPVVAVCCART